MEIGCQLGNGCVHSQYTFAINTCLVGIPEHIGSQQNLGNKTKHKETVIAEKIHKEFAQGLEDLRPEDYNLLSIKLDELNNMSREQQEYWLLAVEMACLCGQMELFPFTGIG